MVFTSLFSKDTYTSLKTASKSSSTDSVVLPPPESQNSTNTDSQGTKKIPTQSKQTRRQQKKLGVSLGRESQVYAMSVTEKNRYMHRGIDRYMHRASLDLCAAHPPRTQHTQQMTCTLSIYIQAPQYIYYTRHNNSMGFLRLVRSLKLQASFAEDSLFYRAILQKRRIILRSLLIIATPYLLSAYVSKISIKAIHFSNQFIHLNIQTSI